MAAALSFLRYAMHFDVSEAVIKPNFIA